MPRFGASARGRYNPLPCNLQPVHNDKKTRMSTCEEITDLHAPTTPAAWPQVSARESLKAFADKHPDNEYRMRFLRPECATACRISYLPAEQRVERKSLYLSGWRNDAAFHEDRVTLIMNDLIAPKHIEVLDRRAPFSNYGASRTHCDGRDETRLCRYPSE